MALGSDYAETARLLNDFGFLVNFFFVFLIKLRVSLLRFVDFFVVALGK